MEAMIAIGLLLFCAATFWPLRKLLHSPTRPAWLRGGVGADAVMLAHLLLLVFALVLLAHSQLYG